MNQHQAGQPVGPTERAVRLLGISPVIPVVVVHDERSAVPLAQALADGGIGVIEVTLRTAAGLAAIEQIAAGVPDIVVGAGTVTRLDQIAAVEAAGAEFVVTPGSPPHLLDALEQTNLPVLAGAATLTEMMTLQARGHRTAKFFPAENAGGVGYLKSVSGPLPDLLFCPTGGISVDTAADYLALSNVGCVGGSWLTPTDLVAAGDWAQITALAEQAATLR